MKPNNEEDMRKAMMFGGGGFLGRAAEFGRDRSLTYKVQSKLANPLFHGMNQDHQNNYNMQPSLGGPKNPEVSSNYPLKSVITDLQLDETLLLCVDPRD